MSLFTIWLVSIVLLTFITITIASSWSPTCTPVSGKIPRLIPDPTDCKSMFVCLKGKPRQYFCPFDQVFDASRQECIKRLDCSKSAGEHSDFDDCPPKNGKYAVYFPHPTDCNMYYQCDHGTAYPRECPPNLHFNPQKNVCDWAHSANCKARFITPKL